MNRTDRLVAVLLELQARGELRAEDLASRFEVSVRTIYRDLEALSESGVPLLATPGKGYKLLEGYFLPPLAFTATEAALLVLGGDFVRQRVDAELRGPAEDALRKLAAILPEDRRQAVARWRRELLFPRVGVGGRDDLPSLPRLRRAIQERRVVRLLYHAFRRAEPEPREVEPVSLVFFGEHWQLAGYCRLRAGPRLFRLDRIDHLEVLGERFSLDARHVMPAPRDDWRTSVPEARVRFDPSVERWARERQPFVFLREELHNGEKVFVYAIREEQQLLPWLLSWGVGVEVLDPPWLRARLAAEAQRIARHHVAADRQLSRALAHAGGDL